MRTRHAATFLLLLLLPLAAHCAEPGRKAFDHLTTGFELTGRHLDTGCESCHVSAVF